MKRALWLGGARRWMSCWLSFGLKVVVPVAAICQWLRPAEGFGANLRAYGDKCWVLMVAWFFLAIGAQLVTSIGWRVRDAVVDRRLRAVMSGRFEADEAGSDQGPRDRGAEEVDGGMVKRVTGRIDRVWWVVMGIVAATVAAIVWQGLSGGSHKSPLDNLLGIGERVALVLVLSVLVAEVLSCVPRYRRRKADRLEHSVELLSDCTAEYERAVRNGRREQQVTSAGTPDARDE